MVFTQVYFSVHFDDHEIHAATYSTVLSQYFRSSRISETAGTWVLELHLVAKLLSPTGSWLRSQTSSVKKCIGNRSTTNHCKQSSRIILHYGLFLFKQRHKKEELHLRSHAKAIKLPNHHCVVVGLTRRKLRWNAKVLHRLRAALDALNNSTLSVCHFADTVCFQRFTFLIQSHRVVLSREAA